MLQPFKALQPFNKSNLPFNLSVAQNKTAYLEQQIAAIYRDTEGVWYDPSDIGRYMATGPELVVNGDFSSGMSGWAESSPGTWVFASGTAYLPPIDSTYRDIRQAIPLASGKKYIVTAGLVVLIGQVTFGINTAGNASVYNVGTNVIRYVVDGSVGAILFCGRAGAAIASCYLDNISVKELPVISTATMWQDAAGTIPVTGVEQPVGLILDKSKGLVLGSELVANRGFDTDTWWLKDTGCSISGGTGNFSGLSNAAIYKSGILTSNKSYSVTWTIVSISGGGLQVQGGNSSGPLVSTPGTYTHIIIAGTSSFNIRAVGATIAAVDNISVRELPGSHASQTVSTKRPTLSSRYNLLTKTEDFSDAVWAKARSSVTPNAGVAPNGTTTAAKLVETSVTDSHVVFQPFTYVNGASYSFTVFLKKAERAQALVLFAATQATSANKGICVNLEDGTLVSGAYFTAPGDLGSTGYSIKTLPSGWFQVTISATTNTTTGRTPYVCTAANGAAITVGDGASGIYIWGASLVPADQANLPYQRVNTATDYDAVGFPMRLAFDGVDDALSTPSIDFTSTDKMTVVAGVRKLSDAASGVAHEFGPNSLLAAGFALFAPSSNGVNSYAFVSTGTVLSIAGQGAFAPAPNTGVISGVGDISGDISRIRVNGAVQHTAGTNQGYGTYGFQPLNIGARAGTSLFLNGHIYSLMIFGKTLTPSQLATVERYTGRKTGITL